ncbi:MAG: chromate resistance protein ChrB domain-containing protein [Parvularculaceae bacterium]
MIAFERLISKLGTEDWPRIYDMRGDDEVAKTPRLLPAARRLSQGDLIAAVAAEPGARTAAHVVYCQKGGPRAEAAAAALRAEGYGVESLIGGVTAWLAADGPTIASTALGSLQSPSRWITRARPKIDRIACPWLIRRFVDARAVFHYVEAASVFDAARLLQAEPYDIDGAKFSHDDDECSFDAFIKAFDIRDEALARVATIVRGADTSRLDLAPESAGLLAMSLGLSAACERDEDMLARATTLYDGLYAWARSASAERHNWTSKPA